MSSPRVLLSPLGGAAVQLRDSTFPPGVSRWMEVRFDYEQGGPLVTVYADEDVAGWPEYGRPS